MLLTDGRNDDDRKEIDALNEHEEVELTVVALSNAIVYPRTMMVVSIDTYIAENTMSASWSSDHFTVWAQTAGLERIQKLQEVEIGVFLDYSRVTPPDDDTEEHGQAEQALRRPKEPIRVPRDAQQLVR